MKKIIAVLLCACMLLSLAACGSNGGGSKNDSTAGGGEQTGEKHLIGYNIWGAGDPIFDSMTYEMNYTFDTLGVEYSYASDNYSADTELDNQKNFVSADVDGIVMQVNADAILENAAQVCLEGKMPFVLSIFVGEEEQRAKIAAGNEYFIGSVDADLYTDGYLMGKAAADDGMKTVVIIGGNVGDYHFDIRKAGFEKAFVEEGGGTVLDEARCSSPAECTEKANALLSAHKDADCVFALVGSYLSGTLTAQDQLGITDQPLYVSNGDEATGKYIKEGRVKASCGGNDLAECVAIALMVNYLDGHQIKDADGNVPQLSIVPFLVNESNVDTYLEVFFADNAHPFTQDALKNLTYRFNNDVSFDTFKELVENGTTLEALAQAQGK